MKKLVVFIAVILVSSIFIINAYANIDHRINMTKASHKNIHIIKTIDSDEKQLPLINMKDNKNYNYDFQHYRKPLSHRKNGIENQTDIPTWNMGDQWVYYADIYSDSENGIFDLTSTDLTVTVVDLTTMTQNGSTWDIYIISISGNVSGSFSSGLLSGDVDGDIIGNASIRRSDLALITSNISSFGVVEYLIFTFDYETSNAACYRPPLEYFDFPIKSDEMWNISSNISTQSSFYVEDFYDNSSTSNDTVEGIVECPGVENISVPAGSFTSFHILTEENGTIESWYSPVVCNIVKSFINRTTENETSLIYMNLSSYLLSTPSIIVTQEINPNVTTVGAEVTISGFATNATSGEPISNAVVSIKIPSIDDEWQTTTNETGYYAYIITAPIVMDDTDTTYDIGSDGVIVTVFSNSSVGYKIKTLTIIEISSKIADFLYGWNFVSLPFNQSIDLVDLTVNYGGTDYTWADATSVPIVDPNVYGWDRSLDMYVPATTMEPGYGYWIYAYFDCELWVENLSATPDDFITDLNQKWNSIGVPSLQTTNLSDFIVNYLGADYNWTEATDPVNGPIVDPNVYGWSRTMHMYVPVADTLEPGYAYWMYAYQNCTLKRVI